MSRCQMDLAPPEPFTADPVTMRFMLTHSTSARTGR